MLLTCCADVEKMLVQGESSQLDGRRMDVASPTGQTFHGRFPRVFGKDFLVGGGGSWTSSGPHDKKVSGVTVCVCSEMLDTNWWIIVQSA